MSSEAWVVRERRPVAVQGYVHGSPTYRHHDDEILFIADTEEAAYAELRKRIRVLLKNPYADFDTDDKYYENVFAKDEALATARDEFEKAIETGEELDVAESALCSRYNLGGPTWLVGKFRKV